jgi:hypothetical protein
VNVPYKKQSIKNTRIKSNGVNKKVLEKPTIYLGNKQVIDLLMWVDALYLMLKLSVYINQQITLAPETCLAGGMIFTQWWKLKTKRSLVHLESIRKLTVPKWMSITEWMSSFLWDVMLRNVPEEWRAPLHRSGSLKSDIATEFIVEELDKKQCIIATRPVLTCIQTHLTWHLVYFTLGIMSLY